MFSDFEEYSAIRTSLLSLSLVTSVLRSAVAKVLSCFSMVKRVFSLASEERLFTEMKSYFV